MRPGLHGWKLLPEMWDDFLLEGGVFNVDQIEGYMELKWEEIYAVEHTPHPVEYGLYYSL